MKFKGVNLNKIDKMGALAFKNCLRLHFDSIVLFNSKSYPSALYFSILSLEEFGKAILLSDFVWHSRVDGRYNAVQDKDLKKEFGEDLEHYVLKEIYSHSYKQRYFASEMLQSRKKPSRLFKSIVNNELETEKQNSMYVGFTRKKGKIDFKSKIKHPFNIKREKVLKQITRLNDILLELVLLDIIYNEGYLFNLESSESIVTKQLYQKLFDVWKFKSKPVLRRLKKCQKI